MIATNATAIIKIKLAALKKYHLDKLGVEREWKEHIFLFTMKMVSHTGLTLSVNGGNDL